MNFEIALSPTSIELKAGFGIKEFASTSGHDSPDTGSSNQSLRLFDVTTDFWKDNQPRLPRNTANSFIQRDQSFLLGWGYIVDGDFTNFLEDGTWKADFFLEKIGHGEIPSDIPSAVRTHSVSGLGRYREVFRVIPPNTLAVGIYKVTSTLQWIDKNGRPGPITAISDANMIRIYEDS